MPSNLDIKFAIIRTTFEKFFEKFKSNIKKLREIIPKKGGIRVLQLPYTAVGKF